MRMKIEIECKLTDLHNIDTPTSTHRVDYKERLQTVTLFSRFTNNINYFFMILVSISFITYSPMRRNKMNERINGWMDGMDGWMDGWINRWKDGWMDGWMNGWIDG